MNSGLFRVAVQETERKKKKKEMERARGTLSDMHKSVFIVSTIHEMKFHDMQQ